MAMTTEAADAADAVLLSEGRHAELLARHYPALRERARLRLDPFDADEVAHMAIDRLIAELRRGRTWAVPFRVVAHQVLGWAMKDWWGRRRDDPLPAGWDAAVAEDGYRRVEDRLTLEEWFSCLPDRVRGIMRLRYIEGWEITAIAEELDMTRNAVDQALHRGTVRLRGRGRDG